MMTVIEVDVTAQRRGMIHIQYEVSSAMNKADSDGKSIHNDDGYRMPRELYMYGPLMASSIPVRLAAIHYCYDNINVMPAMRFLRLIGSNLRCRLREHYGASSSICFLMAT